MAHFRSASRRVRLSPLVEAVAVAFMGFASAAAQAQTPAPVGGAWFASPQSVNASREARPAPTNADATLDAAALRQQQAARQTLQRSVDNLERTAAAIAAQQAAQRAARDAAALAATGVPDGLARGGLWDRDANGALLPWSGAERPEQKPPQDGKTHVVIRQTRDKAILNWDTFNVGRNTTVDFQQNSTDAVLNRVTGADARPSQILGAIKGNGTVMVVNQNGIVFTGTSQVNVRNLVAAAARIDDAQFRERGLYGANGGVPTFTEARGNVEVRAGAQIVTHRPASSTTGGGYVLLLGAAVAQAGQIVTPVGQTVLAAGDSFYIRKGVGTEGNTTSTTAGHEVSTARAPGSTAGRVTNTGLILAETGDVTLTGHDVVQAGVIAATTSTAKRGTIHLSSRAGDTTGTVALAGGVTAVLLDGSVTTALDAQREAAIKQLSGVRSTNDPSGVFDNLGTITDRTDLSRIEIVSGNTVAFQDGSLTLATGGDIAVSAVRRALVENGAELDVSGAVGVRVAMESNALNINVQGNEQRDSPGNRDGKTLTNSDVWVDRRRLVYVPAGTNGYATDRWYTQGGLLEVGGYLANRGRTVGEWMAQGGTVTVTGGDLVTRAGSGINLSGGTIDVQSGGIRQTWVKAADGRLYELSSAPGDLLYAGLYHGYELGSKRWGHTDYHFSPLIGAASRDEPGYTVGRDAGKLVVATGNALLEGKLIGAVYQGDTQNRAPQAGLDGFNQSQLALARGAELVIGKYEPRYDAGAGVLRYAYSPTLERVTLAATPRALAANVTLDEAVDDARKGRLELDAAVLGAMKLGAVRIAARQGIGVESALQVAAGGEIVLYAPAVEVRANLVARGGTLRLGNVLAQPEFEGDKIAVKDVALAVPDGVLGGIRVRDGAVLDARGLIADLRTAGADPSAAAYADGGKVSLRSTSNVTLERGTLIDVTSGGVVRPDASVAGGRGGSVHLGSGLAGTGLGDPLAVLTLDGEIRGHGVKGGGTLDIESASAISIGGKLLDKAGLLDKGRSALADLVTAEDLRVAAGEPLPADYSYRETLARPGERLGAPPIFFGLVLAADWTLPYASPVAGGNPYYISYRVPGEDVPHQLEVKTAKDAMGRVYVIPAGATIISPSAYGEISIDYVVPAQVFPHGVPVAAHTRIARAGSSLPFEVVVPKGSVIPAGTVVVQPIAVGGTTELATGLFQSGFADYRVRALRGVAVQDGVRLDVVQPVVAPEALLRAASDPSGAMPAPWLPERYLADAVARKVTQRQGASLLLAGGLANDIAKPGDGGNVHVGQDAVITVDPGQSIALSSRGNLMVNGTLRAQGGRISLMGPQSSRGELDKGGLLADGSGAERRIEVGANALLDVSAASHTALDAQGRPYGVLGQGGRIVVGGTVQESGSRALASDAFVVIRQGAVLDASGSSARFDVDGGGVRTLVSDGGAISLASARGLYLDGSLRAREGGAGASGGHLTVALEAPLYEENNVTDPRLLSVRELQVAQRRESAATPDVLEYGHARLGVNQVGEGGFAALTLYGNGPVTFAGDVDLAMSRELRLYSGALAVAGGAAATSKVSLSAPYLLLAGITDTNPNPDGYARPSYRGGFGARAPLASLTASARLIDIKGEVTLGLDRKVSLRGLPLRAERAGFGQLNVVSSGDIRFVATESINPTWQTQLLSPGDILLRADQIYPATGVGARVLAGRTDENTYDPDSRLTIRRYDPQAARPAVPYSVFGRLTLGAATIEQQGIVRAPLGSITLGTDPVSAGFGYQVTTKNIVLSPGSLTSVSAAGLVMPYGGTVDGVSYLYRGQPVTFAGAGTGPAITLSGERVAVEAGAALDLSGGGELTGAGFIPGRGGSTDARYHPLMQIGSGGFVLPGLAGNPVYAIVPGYAGAYAPSEATGAVDPRIGQQITLQSGEVPGLAAGRYTLLPSSYALLPGAFRVEINGASTGAAPSRTLALRNGSYSAQGVLSVAGTGIADSLASQLIITPADVLRRYSQYNETGYAGFVRAQGALNGGIRALLPADAKTLAIRLPSSRDSALRFEGAADFTPGKDGYGGSASLVTSHGNGLGVGSLEILGDGASATAGFDGASVRARDLDAIGAARLTIGGGLSSTYSDGRDGKNTSNYLNIVRQTGTVILRDGAILRAPEVFLIAANPQGGIVIEAGAGIRTVGRGKPAYDSTNGYIYRPRDASVVAASNGRIDMLPPVRENNQAASGPVSIGVCGAVCTGSAELYAEGSLIAVTRADFRMSDTVRYGARDLTLAVGAVNAGSREALAAAAAQGILTPGLALNQALLDRLLQGDTAYGVPALERLVLSASESFNLYGTVSLDTTDPATGKARLANLVLSTPAIYGAGGAGDTAVIKTGTFTWAGTGGAAPAPVANGRGTGAGRLAVEAGVIEFGYGPTARPTGIDDASRTVLGFADVAFSARERITANQKGSLAVYAAQNATPDGLRYSGGNLTLSAPLVTGAGGSVNRITAGGALRVVAPAGGAADVGAVQTGAELSLGGDSVFLDTAVALPSGKLTVKAAGDVTLGNAARLDLAGRDIALFDAHRYTWGGDVTLHSTAGSVIQAAGSLIDLSARNNHAGLLTVIALGDTARVELQGNLKGTTSGHYDAGGTLVPWRAGGVNLRTTALGGGANLTDAFGALNARLNEAGFTGERSFQFRQGDLTVGDGLRAREINLSLDGGHLTVTGLVDASGEQTGSIRLAARDGLTVAGGARLDAHGTQLRLDSRGAIIDAPNRAIVELDAGRGTLTLEKGASIDLRHGTDDARVRANPALLDGRARGTLDLIAPRIDANGQVGAAAATYGDIALVTGPNLDIQGAKSIAVYGRQVYNDAPFNDTAKGETSASGRPYQIINTSYLNGKHENSKDFITKALASGRLTSRLAGLSTASYRDVLHVRPAVEIVSATPGGDLIVSGDLDLSGYRYASLNPAFAPTAVYGSGEPGALTLRAGGDLSIYGSITDGFAPPPATPDDNGWWLVPGKQAFGGDVVIPVPGVKLADGTVYPAGKTLNYAIAAKDVTLPAGTTLPTDIVLSAGLTLPAGSVLAADALAADGQVLLARGTVVGPGGLSLPVGARLQTGTRLPVDVKLVSLTWSKGTTLPASIVLSAGLTLPAKSVLSTDVLSADGRVLLARGTEVGQDGLVLPTGARLQAGTLLPVDVTQASLTWPKGAPLPVAMTQQGELTLPVGALIASGTSVVLPDDSPGVDLRPRGADGMVISRSNWAVAAMLPDGSSSWNLRLTAGADTGAADSRLTRPEAGGSVQAADTHYTAKLEKTMTGGTKVYVWADPNNFNGKPGEPVGPEFLDDEPGHFPEHYNVCLWEPQQCVLASINGVERVKATPKSPVFSVLRTGTGDLDIAAAGSFSMQSPYGVYTAGSPTHLGDATLDARYNPARGKVAADGTVLGGNAGDLAPAYEALVSGDSRLDRAWYPDGGGNLRVTVGGDLTGDSWGSTPQLPRGSAGTGNWLWRQGGADRPVAWWINFGTYTFDPAADPANTFALWPAVTGFTGLGTLGGGNATVRVGGNAGMIERRSELDDEAPRSQGVVLAIGGTGRMRGSGQLTQTGGGDLELRIGGGWNSDENARLKAYFGAAVQTHELYGGLINLRGAVDMAAGRVGTVRLIYGMNGAYAIQDGREVRIPDPYVTSQSLATGGLMLTPGDAAISVASRGDLVLGGTADAGLARTASYLPFTSDAGKGEAGLSWFTLWTGRTAVRLLAAGGNLAFDTRAGEYAFGNPPAGYAYLPNGGWFLLPGQVSAAAVQGGVYYGRSAAYQHTGSNLWNNGGLLQVPLGVRRLELLAGGSIYGGGYAISQSGADAASMATVTQPGFAGFVSLNKNLIFINTSPYAPAVAVDKLPLFAFGVNSVGREAGMGEGSGEASRFYAVNGDIVGLRTGTVVKFPTSIAAGIRAGQTDYVAAGPVAVRAGRDIVYTGTRADETLMSISDFFAVPNNLATVSGNLIVHTRANDVSVIEAGRDILYANFTVAGPGTLEMSAGRHIVQNDLASLTSIGPVAEGDKRPGAGIAVLAGVGAGGANYAGLLSRYLDAANLAATGTPLADQPGKVAKTYEAELVEWLGQRYGFTGNAEEARRYLATLAPEQQRIFAREVYFAELRAGGREYNDAKGPRYGSYLRGRNAVAALFPAQDAAGKALAYGGSLLMYGGSGIRTLLGGDIQVLTPGGGQTYGLEGVAPPSTAGVVTQGRGDIRLYSRDSILLGQSRLMTTFGGSILAWSAEGDINAGRGSKTTVVYTPPRRVYDNVGNVTISPTVPSTGAGIATLNPIPEVPAGDVDLIAPLGTIDAGEAGIRVSGNVNVAAMQVANAANIQVQGKSSGVPMAASVNVGAQASASAASSSATQAAGDVMRRQQSAARQNQASQVSVQILGFGNEAL
ncbi:filamentous haemagglutinin family protein [Paludibacterium paludis]|uniref:Filamentous haemagglutinin FhaB/tRNA nuclease CdiA-like TPS domain-containing protein n=1 Tax=Paludibacterium paludis TaxID=1225769 RepID=A0A918NX95_9NEIS|nr:filamentous haemagglutinin family protein [Paludibacterium paludis]GGY04320.1 hypothetical protein GCM10011289_03540 [Paludibacterium paludis]